MMSILGWYLFETQALFYRILRKRYKILRCLCKDTIEVSKYFDVIEIRIEMISMEKWVSW